MSKADFGSPRASHRSGGNCSKNDDGDEEDEEDGEDEEDEEDEEDAEDEEDEEDEGGESLAVPLALPWAVGALVLEALGEGALVEGGRRRM